LQKTIVAALVTSSLDWTIAIPCFTTLPLRIHHKIQNCLAVWLPVDLSIVSTWSLSKIIFYDHNYIHWQWWQQEWDNGCFPI